MRTISRFGTDIPDELTGITSIPSNKVLEIPSHEEIFRAAMSGTKVLITFVVGIEITDYEPDEESKESHGFTDYAGQTTTTEADAKLLVKTSSVEFFVSNVLLGSGHNLTFDGEYRYEYEANYNSVGRSEHKFQFTIHQGGSATYKRLS